MRVGLRILDFHKATVQKMALGIGKIATIFDIRMGHKVVVTISGKDCIRIMKEELNSLPRGKGGREGGRRRGNQHEC